MSDRIYLNFATMPGIFDSRSLYGVAHSFRSDHSLGLGEGSSPSDLDLMGFFCVK